MSAVRWFVVTIALVGCGGGPETPDGSTDATADTSDVNVPDVTDAVSDVNEIDASDSASDAKSDAATPDSGCFVIDAGAPYITIDDVASYAPSATGGPVVIGRYYATKETHFTGDGGMTGTEGSPFAYTLELLSTSTGALRIEANGTQAKTFTYSTSGTTMKIVAVDCFNSTNTIQFEYTTDGGAFEWLPDAGDVGYALSFAKQ